MSKQKPNILFLPKWYPSKFDAFDGNFIENHAKVVQLNCNVAVIFVHSDELDSVKYDIQESSPHGFTEYRIFYKRPKTFSKLINKILGFIRYAKAQRIGFEKYKAQNGNPDLTHVHINGRSAILALRLKSIYKIPFILSEHWSGYTAESGALNGFLRKMAYRFIAKKAKKITTVSNYLKDAMESHGISGNYQIVPNVVNTTIFKPIKKSDRKKKRIIHVSNLSSSIKNMPLIIAALDSVGKERDDFDFDLLGTGPEEAHMLQLLDNSSIKDRYRFHGEIKMEEVAKFLADSDFLILYSTFETQSVIMIESFACGVPVLVSEVGGIPEYMSSERGIMIEPNKLNILIENINKMLDTSDTYKVSDLRDYAVKEFSENTIAEKFQNLYNTIIAHGK